MTLLRSSGLSDTSFDPIRETYRRRGRWARALVLRFFGTFVGRRLVGELAVERPQMLCGAVGSAMSRRSRFTNVVTWPSELAGFEDVAPIVLSSNAANRGIASMRLDEIAHLWRLARESGPATLVEIGRERGGSTLVLAAALDRRAVLFSFDPQTKQGKVGTAFDDELAEALSRYGLNERVRLLVEDSHTATPPDGDYAVVVIDGDPSLDGTRLDFERFGRRARPGGRVLFHDAAPGGPRHATLRPLLVELEADVAFERLPDVGTLADFRRRES
jgi:predicted O-methyltransferase YrrM